MCIDTLGKYVGILFNGCNYTFRNLMVKFFNGEVSLTTPKSVKVEFVQKKDMNEEIVLESRGGSMTVEKACEETETFRITFPKNESDQSNWRGRLTLASHLYK